MRYRFFIMALITLFAGGATLAGEEDPVVEWDGQDPDWPREITGGDGAKAVLYQPQVTSWNEFQRIEARVAVAFAKNSEDTPELGAFEIAAKTEVDLESRLVNLSEFEVTGGTFPSLDDASSQKLLARLEKILPKENLVIDLDRIVANLERVESQARAVELKPDPPVIFTSLRPAVLVLIDGKPLWSPTEKKELEYAVNTNWDLFKHQDQGAGVYYLRHGEYWLSTADLGGIWKPAGKLPKAIKKLPKKNPNWEDVRANVPGKQLSPSLVPQVFMSEVPAELILIADEPRLALIGDSKLLWVTNTESDLFLSTDGSFYYLVSGRWFRAPTLDGPWSFASTDLPAEFGAIPADHPRGYVLSSVPGSREADEAVMLSQIPQKAKVTRSEVTADVQYVGEPEFKAIEGTSMQYAANTQSDVIRVGDLYYLCFQGVWFVSASPSGPWAAADKIPDDIYTIPTSSPVYHTTYVRVYDYGPSWVTYGYTSGYWGAYVGWGCVVYGTGWYYSPWSYYGPGYGYPYYYPYYPTYGMSAWYNPYTGTYGRGASVYGPYGGAGRAAAYNPRTGTYARGGAAWGPYNARGWAEAYNPRTGTYARTRQGANTYGNWGTTGVRRGDDWVRTAHASGDQGSIVAGRTSGGRAGFVARDGNNLYAGRDGNVYRRDSGGWQKYGDGDWSPVDRQPGSGGGLEGARERAGSSDAGARARERAGPGDAAARARDRAGSGTGGSRTIDQLDRDFKSRAQGSQRSRDYKSWKGSSGSSSGHGSWGSSSRGGYGHRGSFGGGRAGGRVGGRGRF